ncbi:serine protease [Neogemmobacter tilapiae]|uniref:Peptidoglycan-binding protein n=1 Tax=Neogemmobacter tilapiae TaxID=875041 RepID=A0A918WGV7_9RHOB|nr:serine protease [Gemmobacter tilapiae]GHC45483.1 peptidoglycan-binding protein [Gemmobacter tilapiae]
MAVRFFLAIWVALTVLVLPAETRAQTGDQVWIQVEALPTLAEGEDRARAYATAFPDVVGHRLRSGWYGILLGPYSREQAALRLSSLIADRMIPADSYLNDGATFAESFWPVGLATPEATEGEPAAAQSEVDEPELLQPENPGLPLLPDETVEEARDSEKLLERPAREALQTALQWFGHYDSSIDGAFGPGTRESMAAWQTTMGYDPTGILTTAQRGELLTAYNDALAKLGLEKVTEAESGIEVTLPMALIQFDHYEPPFVHYAEKDGSGLRVILISQPGDQSSLNALYDTLQTLSVIPSDGPRERLERSFTISGSAPGQEAYAYAALSGGLIKGYLLVWDPAKVADMQRVKAAVQTSFKPVGDRALDPGLVPMEDAQRRGLMAGLEIRRPKLSRSGFFVDGQGAVVTTVQAVEQCSRITLDMETEATVAATDATLGLAVLKPAKALSPRAVGVFGATARVGAEVALSGYSYEDQLPAPTLTFGTLEDVKGLDGQANLNRLAIEALPGDAGGPVLDQAGAVLGVMLPRAEGGTRQLPSSVQHIAAGSALAGLLTQAGVVPPAAEAGGALPPEDLSRKALGMTVLVSCWE